MPHPVVHWEIGAKDRARAQEFYSKLFDWKIDSDDKMDYGEVETGGEGGIDGGIAAAPEAQPFVTFYIQVDDLQAYLDKAVSLGGEAAVPPTEIPNIGYFAMFRDPDGNTLGLFKGRE